MELFVDSSRPRGVTRALYDQLLTLIVTGRVAHGQRLPPTRELARQLGVSRQTITTVYGRLVAEGYLEGCAGGGTHVAFTASPARGVGAPALVPATEPSGTAPPPPGGVDLRIGLPDPHLFPLADWRRCVVAALQLAPAGGSPPPAGHLELRRALSHWIARARGVDADPDDVVITAGAQQAVDLACRVLLHPGDTVAIENPGYRPVRELLQLTGLRAAPVPVDGEGLVVDAVPPEAKLVYVTPSHQSPTGVTMSLHRRQALLDLAARRDLFVIEDDYDSEFRHSDRPLEPLFRLDTSGRVLYVGTFSKTLAPSLKLGFLALPPGMAGAVGALVELIGSQPPLAIQQAMHRFVADGHLERHLRRARRAYAERHAVVTRWVSAQVTTGLLRPGPVNHAGLHLMVRLAHGAGAGDVIARCRAAGVALTSLDDSWSGAPDGEGLLIGFGRAAEPDLTRGLTLLESAIRAPIVSKADTDRTRIPNGRGDRVSTYTGHR